MICPEYTQISNSRQGSLLADEGIVGLGEDLGLAPAAGSFCTELVWRFPAWAQMFVGRG